jgi:excisionase family DNA binding protein
MTGAPTDQLTSAEALRLAAMIRHLGDEQAKILRHLGLDASRGEMTPKAMAFALGLSVDTIKRLCREHRLDAAKRGGRWRIKAGAKPKAKTGRKAA